MSVDKLVDSTQLDADLTSVANAIRAKSGGSGQLAFPSGFVSEIGNIPSGGGGYSVDDILTGQAPSGDVYWKPAANIPNSGTIAGRKSITKLTIDLSDGYTFGTGNAYTILYNEIPVYHIIYNSSTNFPAYLFNSNSSSWKLIITGENVGNLSANMLRNNSGLTHVDITHTRDASIGSNCFNASSSLKHLIIRGATVMSLSDTGVFANSPFASGKSGGTLYVPSSLKSQYEQASNWDTILGYANNSIQTIESSEFNGYYADGTPIPSA